MISQTFKSTCSYCGVGCGVEILKHPSGDLELRGDPSHPSNRGLLCAKGKSLLHTVRATGTRLRFPEMRSIKNTQRERATWQNAIGRIADQFKSIIARYGPDAVAFYISGQCLTEEYYLANKIAKGFLQTNNIDTNSRLCMSSAVAGYKATLGADAPPTTYDDIDLADTFLIAGANPAWCHPVLFQRIQARKVADPSVQIIVIDPRKTATAAVADLHLQLIPGTDVPLFLGLANRLGRTGQLDHNFLKNHTTGAAEFLQSTEPWTLAATAQATGLAEADIARAADLLAGDRRFLSMWTMGLNQSAAGTDKNIALISLSLITGKIGKRGCGPFSLTGQPNAMGGREVGGMANLLPAHRDMNNPQHREQVAKFWNVPSIPATPGLTAVELFDAIGRGKVKAVWIIATNPVASLPASWRIEESLAKADLVIAQDIYPTETTDLADIVLPAAGWLEKTGTMTNSDRRISLLQKAVDPPGEALPDAEILQQFAHAMGWQTHFNYKHPADIFAEHAALTKGTDIDITALSHETLKVHGPTQWPAPAQVESSSTPRLYTDHRFPTPTGRARLQPLTFESRSEQPSTEHPLVLTTGRIRDQWHTMTKTGQVNRLSAHIDSPFCEIHPADAALRNIAQDDIITVSNPRGQVRLRAVVTDSIRHGVLFLPMHWGKKLAGPNGRANNLTSARLDPVSKQPDLKFAAVQAQKFLPPKRRIVIVGAGAAALAFIEKHRQFNQFDDILLLGGENLPLYNRVLLPHYLDGSASWPSMIRADRDSLQPHHVIFHHDTLICNIDKTAKTVSDARGRTFSYDTLILATGSRAAIHYDGPIPDTGTFTLRSRKDAEAILETAANSRHIVIQGGGLLGLEVADALHRLRAGQADVTILQRSDKLMGKQLDAAASALLVEELRHRGINVLLNTIPVELVGDEKVIAVRAATQSTLETRNAKLDCDLFIFATGIIANQEIAGIAGLDCNRGILVNRHLQTSSPDIFAIGECAEFQDQTFGTTTAATQQAHALAEFLRGNEHSPYKPAASPSILKVHNFQLAAAGITDPDPSSDPAVETLILADPRKHYYQKLVIKNDRLVGAICMGDTAAFSQYLDWITTGRELDDDRNTLLRPNGSGANLLDGPLVCACHHVGKNTIAKAAALHGRNIDAVVHQTRAGTGCGVCRPEIAQILNAIQ